MRVNIYITTINAGRLRCSTNAQGWYAVHGGMEAAPEGLVLQDPRFIEKDCIKALKIVRNFCRTHNLDYKIYNVKDTFPAIRAWLAGVKEQPTIIIGKKRIVGIPTFEDLSSCL